MLLKADSNIKVVSLLFYFFGLFIMFTMSCLYHSFKYGTTVKKIFRIFDYSSIYLLIGATFVPLLLVFIGGKYGIIFFVMQWLIIIIGITFIAVFGPNNLRKMHLILYILLGWSGVILLPRMFKNIELFTFILGGGIIYSLGIIPFLINKKCSHFIWHFFVFIGAIVQWIGIYFFVF